MTQVEESQREAKIRINDLKTYLYSLRDHIDERPHSKTPKIENKIECVHVDTKPLSLSKESNSKREEKKAKIESLKMQIQAKIETLCGKNSISKSQKLALDSNKSIPVSVRVYQSKWKSVENLSRVIDLLTDDDWEMHGLYMGRLGFFLVGENGLSPFKISFMDIEFDSLQKHDKYIRFFVGGPNEKVFILDFGQKQIGAWSKFMNYVCSSKEFMGIKEEKWNETSLREKKNFKENKNSSFQSKNQEVNKSENSLFLEKLSSIKNDSRIQIQAKSNLHSSSLWLPKKVVRKDSEKSESFVLSNSTEKNRNTHTNNNTNFQIDIIKIKSDKFNESLQFEIVDRDKEANRSSKYVEEITLKDMVIGDLNSFSQSQFMNKVNLSDQANISSDKIIVSDEEDKKYLMPSHSKVNKELTVTEKVKNKLSEKMKLLEDSSFSKLNIHWHEESETEPVLIPEASEIPDLISNQSSTHEIRLFSKKKDSFSSKNHEISERPDAGDSPISKKRIESAFTKEVDNTSLHDTERIRKKTDFSLQNETKVESDRRRNKNEIRDHYLHRLIEKERSRNGNNSTSTNKEDQNLLIPIPERKTSSISHYESIKFDSNDSKSSSSSSNESTEQEIELQELKNGIILEKCSKRMPWTQDKKLCITNTLAELCYSEQYNEASDERKFFLKDVLSIEYGKFDAGIMKHKKKYVESRCLLIRVRLDGKEKFLEFYLEESEPVENLEDFARKLKSFVEREKRREEDSYD